MKFFLTLLCLIPVIALGQFIPPETVDRATVTTDADGVLVAPHNFFSANHDAIATALGLSALLADKAGVADGAAANFGLMSMQVSGLDQSFALFEGTYLAVGTRNQKPEYYLHAAGSYLSFNGSVWVLHPDDIDTILYFGIGNGGQNTPADVTTWMEDQGPPSPAMAVSPVFTLNVAAHTRDLLNAGNEASARGVLEVYSKAQVDALAGALGEDALPANPVFLIANAGAWTDFELKGMMADNVKVWYYHSPDPEKDVITGQIWDPRPRVWFTDSSSGGVNIRRWHLQNASQSIAAQLGDPASGYVGGWIVMVRGLDMTRDQLGGISWSYALFDGASREEDPMGRQIWRPVVPVDFQPDGYDPNL